jgi:hypothetical protein
MSRQFIVISPLHFAAADTPTPARHTPTVALRYATPPFFAISMPPLITPDAMPIRRQIMPPTFAIFTFAVPPDKEAAASQRRRHAHAANAPPPCRHA